MNASGPNARRLFLTVGRKRCPFRCAYCFTDFSQYLRPPTIDEVEADSSLLRGIDVVYPACDVDLYALATWKSAIERTLALGKSISLSTKSALTAEQVDHAADVSQRSAEAGKQFKVGVSFSTRFGCGELEPFAPAYAERLASLRSLAARRVPVALVLRPLLADVDPIEYTMILKDVRPYTDVVLTGPEHLDDDPTHTRRTITTPHVQATPRTITWAASSPTWLSREPVAQLAAIRRTGSALGFRIFERDLELMDALAADAARLDARATG